MSEGEHLFGPGKPDYQIAIKQHSQYCDALRETGLEVTVLEPEPAFPDGHFVEDTAVITVRGVIMTRPGVQSRLGEEKEIEKHLRSDLEIIGRINYPGILDGGDVLRVRDKLYVGISERTNESGFNQLKDILNRIGFDACPIPIQDVLHLKTGLSFLGKNSLLAIATFSKNRTFQNYNIIEIPDQEDYAANCLVINDYIIIPKGFPKTKALLKKFATQLIEVEMSEFQKMDGGLTCLSIIY